MIQYNTNLLQQALYFIKVQAIKIIVVKNVLIVFYMYIVDVGDCLMFIYV